VPLDQQQTWGNPASWHSRRASSSRIVTAVGQHSGACARTQARTGACVECYRHGQRRDRPGFHLCGVPRRYTTDSPKGRTGCVHSGAKVAAMETAGAALWVELEVKRQIRVFEQLEAARRERGSAPQSITHTVGTPWECAIMQQRGRLSSRPALPRRIPAWQERHAARHVAHSAASTTGRASALCQLGLSRRSSPIAALRGQLGLKLTICSIPAASSKQQQSNGTLAFSVRCDELHNGSERD
jgi:hypothetical protein